MLVHPYFTLLAALASLTSITIASDIAERDMSEITATVQPVPRAGAAISMATMEKPDDGAPLTTFHPVPRTAVTDPARIEGRSLSDPDAAHQAPAKRAKRRLPTYRWQDLQWIDGVAMVDDCETMVLTVIDCNQRTASGDCTAICHFAETGETDFSSISFDDLHIVNRQNANRETLW